MSDEKDWYDLALEEKRAIVARQELAEARAQDPQAWAVRETSAERQTRLTERWLLIVWLAVLVAIAALAFAGVTNWYLAGPGVLFTLWRLGKTFES